MTSHGRSTVSTVSRAHAAGCLLLAATLLAAGCGGGGGGGNGGGGGSPTPTPAPGTSATPRPTTTPAPTPTDDGSARARIILAENDVVDGVDVVDVEDAALNGAGAVAAIVTARGTGGARALLLGDTGGAFATLVAADATLSGGDTRTLARVRLAETGAAIFESGEGLDTDRLYFASDGTVQAIAGAEPGVTAPTFRILGDVVIGGSGLVGFVGGGNDCEVTVVGETTRTECTGHLFVAEDGAVSEVKASGLALEEISPTQPQVAVTDTGLAYFSAPASGDGPVLLRWDAGDVDTVLANDAELPEVGRLIRPQVAAANANEQLLLTTTLASDPGPSRPTVLGILEGQDFLVLDREREEAPGGIVTDLRAVGLDEQGRALYVVRTGATLDEADAPRTLRLKDSLTAVDVATEGQTLPGTDKTVISIESQRLNRRGDVAFIAELGRVDGITTVIEEVRAVVRLADGRYLAPVSSARPGDLGTLGNFEIAGFDDNANLLLIATRSPNQTVLVFAPPQGS